MIEEPEVLSAAGSERRRREIVEASVDVFARLGFGGASVRELAAGAGIEKGHITYYFRTKEELLFEVVADFHRRFNEGIEAWSAAADDAVPTLWTVLMHHVTAVCHSRLATRVAYENMRFLSSDHRREIVVLRSAYESRLAELVEACRPVAPVVDEPTRLLTKLLLAIVNWPYHWFDPQGPRTAAELASLYADRALAAIGVDVAR